MKWRICLEDGCPEMSQHLRCPTHTRNTPRSPSSTLTSAAGYKKLRQEILDRDNGICHLCGLPGADTADHDTPAAWDGENTHANLRAAHRACNRAKGDDPLWLTPDAV